MICPHVQLIFTSRAEFSQEGESQAFRNRFCIVVGDELSAFVLVIINSRFPILYCRREVRVVPRNFALGRIGILNMVRDLLQVRAALEGEYFWLRRGLGRVFCAVAMAFRSQNYLFNMLMLPHRLSPLDRMALTLFAGFWGACETSIYEELMGSSLDEDMTWQAALPYSQQRGIVLFNSVQLDRNITTDITERIVRHCSRTLQRQNALLRVCAELCERRTQANRICTSSTIPAVNTTRRVVQGIFVGILLSLSLTCALAFQSIE